MTKTFLINQLSADYLLYSQFIFKPYLKSLTASEVFWKPFFVFLDWREIAYRKNWEQVDNSNNCMENQ